MFFRNWISPITAYGESVDYPKTCSHVRSSNIGYTTLSETCVEWWLNKQYPCLFIDMNVITLLLSSNKETHCFLNHLNICESN